MSIFSCPGSLAFGLGGGRGGRLGYDEEIILDDYLGESNVVTKVLTRKRQEVSQGKAKVNIGGMQP